MSHKFKSKLESKRPKAILRYREQKNRQQFLINQSTSDQAINSCNIQNPSTRKSKKYLRSQHLRNTSEDNHLKHVAKYMLVSSIDQDIEKLENVTLKNQLARKGLLEVQEKMMLIGMNRPSRLIRVGIGSSDYPCLLYTSPSPRDS